MSTRQKTMCLMFGIFSLIGLMYDVEAGEQEKPNVLVILADDQGYGDVRHF